LIVERDAVSYWVGAVDYDCQRGEKRGSLSDLRGGRSGHEAFLVASTPVTTTLSAGM